MPATPRPQPLSFTFLKPTDALPRLALKMAMPKCHEVDIGTNPLDESKSLERQAKRRSHVQGVQVPCDP